MCILSFCKCIMYFYTDFAFNILAPAGVPQNLEVSDISSTGALLTWQPPELELRNGIIRQYNISMVEMYSGKITSHMSLQNWTTLDGLHPYYTYSVAVAAETISAGPFTNNVNFTTLQARELGTQDYLYNKPFLLLFCLFVFLQNAFTPLSVYVSYS